MKLKLILILSLFSLGLHAQVTDVEGTLKEQSADTTDGWDFGGTISLNFNQVSLTNWAAGGQNSISGNGLLSLSSSYKKNNGIWENYFDLGFGTMKQGKNENWWKTDDKLDFTSKYGQKAFSDWYYAGLLNFKTQMAKGYNYPNDSTVISNFLAPGYLLMALGIDYKPSKDFTVFFALLTGKLTFVTDQELANAGAFGVDPAIYDTGGLLLSEGKNLRSEFGGYIRLFHKVDLMENISLQNKLDLFTNYLDHPQNIDVSWEMLLTMKVNKYISASLFTHLLYDDDITIEIDNNDDGIIDEAGPRVQFKELLGVGLSYKF